MANDVQLFLPGLAKRDVTGPPSTAPTYLSDTASGRSSIRRRFVGSQRFNAEELRCFHRVPTPSPMYSQKFEVYWQTVGSFKKVRTDSLLKVPKGDLLGRAQDPGIQEKDQETAARSEPDRPDRPALLPYEEMTASLLDEIFPRSPPCGDKEEDAKMARLHKLRKQTASNLPETTSHATDPPNFASGKALPAGSRRLVQFRQKILDKFSTMKSAFETYASEHGPHGVTKELSKKEFQRFLVRHFAGLPKEEHGKIFEFLDQDKNGAVSLDEFHTAIEAAAPVKSLEDLRRKWVALGYSSMRQALLNMDLNKDPGRSFTLQEFGVLLSRVGVEEEIEHQNIFAAIRDPHSSCQTVTLEMLAAAMSAISPSLLLEDLRDKILKRFGSLSNCFAALDMDQGDSLDIGEFIRYAVPAWKLTTHEAAKAFRLIDVDGSLQISKDEFVTALTLSEPNLYLDEIRRKVRQRFRGMRGLLNPESEDLVDELKSLELEPPPAVEIAASRRTSLYQRHSIMGQETPTSGEAVSRSESRRASWIARHSGIGLEKAQNFLKDLVKQQEEKEDEGRTPEEYQELLNQVQLSEQDTRALFNLMDVNRDGKLSTTEFEHGVRLFAPSTALEDLRLACITKYGGIPEAFASLRTEQREAYLEFVQLKKLLEDLSIWDENTGDLRLIMDIVESHRDGGTSICELMAALQAGQTGTQVRLPPDQRDAKARQQVKWQMAPFHRSANELRASVREKPTSEQPEWLDRRAREGAKARHADVKKESQNILQKLKRDKSLPAVRRVEGGSQDPSWAGPARGGEDMSSNSIPFGPIRTSYMKVSLSLQDLDKKESGPLRSSIHQYYSNAGETVTSREGILCSPHSRYKQFKSCSHHYKLLTRQPGGL
ncbi:unnamed protein product [Durusdinium trenchii]|uniref:EF-hand domain-containing protein n=1 Tax=Durusdinium trenchii TaxID=1381693 RepID=A0ABP0K668_9DINO